jgi:hypothetical protein
VTIPVIDGVIVIPAFNISKFKYFVYSLSSMAFSGPSPPGELVEVATTVLLGEVISTLPVARRLRLLSPENRAAVSKAVAMAVGTTVGIAVEVEGCIEGSVLGWLEGCNDGCIDGIDVG